MNSAKGHVNRRIVIRLKHRPDAFVNVAVISYLINAVKLP